MKLKSLLLTSLVALALGACSSNEEATGVQTEKNAYLGFSIAMPTAATTKADNTATSDGTNVGTTAENAVQTIEVRVVQAGADVYNQSLPVADFAYANGVYTLLAAHLIPVNAGTADVFVTVNGDVTRNSSDGATNTTAAAYTNSLLSDITVSGQIANDNNFLMSGKTAGVTIAADQVNTATVNVDRVAAKIQDFSIPVVSSNSFTVSDRSTKTTTSTTVAIKLDSYSFINLNKTSYVFAQGTTYPWADGNFFLFNKQDGTDKAFTIADANWTAITPLAEGVTTKTVANGTTYLMEHKVTTTDLYPTAVVYKAEIQIDGATTGNVYTYEKTVDGVKGTFFYKSFAELNADNNNIFSNTYGLSESSDFSAFSLAGVTKYTAGICYYVVPVLTAGSTTGSIVRNNWYNLKVNQITHLGTGVIDPGTPTKNTYLDLIVIVNPWIVNTNTISL
jgi:enamine deaminase RidA (YjgF/YER057c/UK114 family)